MPGTPKVRAIGYVRVSTEEQANSALGLEAQRASIKAAAERLGLELVDIKADEGFSGGLAPYKRPGLAATLEELGRGEVLLVAKRDRLGRDHLESGIIERDLARVKSRVVSAAGEGTEDDSPASKLLRGMLDLFAEFERNMGIDRTKAALRAKRARGGRAGAVPFGFRLTDTGQLEELREEQEAIAAMKALREEGKGYRAIARELEGTGHRPRGAKWHPSSVRSILETADRHRSSGEWKAPGLTGSGAP